MMAEMHAVEEIFFQGKNFYQSLLLNEIESYCSIKIIALKFIWSLLCLLYLICQV